MSAVWPTIALVLAGAYPATLDLTDGWRFNPEPPNAAVAQGWSSPGFADDTWRTLSAGKRWEDQGYPDLDGAAWYRKRVDVPAEWAGKKIWLVLGGVNDAYTLYCNGVRVAAYGDDAVCSTYESTTVSDLSAFLEPGKSAMLALRVVDWGGNGGLWRSPCNLTSDPAQLPNVPDLATYLSYDTKQLVVDAKLRGLPIDRGDSQLRFDLCREGHARPVASRTVALPPGQFTATVTFPLPRRRNDEGPWRVRAVVTNAAGIALGNPESAIAVTLPAKPSWPAPYAKLKILNNLVTELLNERISDSANKEFLNPREGWVFTSLASSPAATDRKAPVVCLDGAATPLCLRRNPDTGAQEAMTYLPEGRHSVQITAAGTATLVIRAVPELAYCAYPGGPLLNEHGVYDWPYVERYVLSHVNTIIGGAVGTPEFAQWMREGRKWIANCSLAGMNGPEPPPVDAVLKSWGASPGVTNPQYGGIIVDEFVESTEANYRVWAEAVRRLRADPRFAGKVFYGYCGNFYPSPDVASMAFYKTVLDCGYRFSLERYLVERPTLAETRLGLLRELQHTHNAWTAAFPEFGRHTVMNLGYLSAPPETSNVNPGTNYKVFLEMQYRMLATDPAFWGLYGVMQYNVGYADEEAIRWAHRLIRHYCIEGSTTTICKDPYVLPHVQNPDFADGLRGWDARPAVEGVIGTRKIDGFGWLQGRLENVPPSGDGDQFLWMKRSAEKPNTVSQTMVKLQPGRVYSLKLISADLGAMDKKQRLAVSARIDDADMLDSGSFQSVFQTCSTHVGQHGISNQAWMNYHRILFRPRKTTAKLTLSDWAAPDAPGGPVGQELAVNFVEVQPFLEP